MPHFAIALPRLPALRLRQAALLALGTGLSLMAGGGAGAQSYYPPAYSPPAAAPEPAYGPGSAYAPAGMLPPPEVQSIVLNMGFRDVGWPYLQGRTYFLPALSAEGPLTLAVDAYTGRVSTVGVRMYGIPYYEPPMPAQRGRGNAARTPPALPPAPPKPKPQMPSQIAAPPAEEVTPSAQPQAPAVSNAPAAPALSTVGRPETAPAKPSEQTPAAGSASPPIASRPSPAQPAQANPAQNAAPSPSAPLSASGGTGGGSATPADGVSAGSPSVLSRGMAPQGGN